MSETCIQCRAEGKTPDSLIEQCVHCHEPNCADSHIQYIDRKPVCTICAAWVCSECGEFVDSIVSWPVWGTDGEVRSIYRLCRSCQPKPKIVSTRKGRQRQQEADDEARFQRQLGGPDAA